MKKILLPFLLGICLSLMPAFAQTKSETKQYQKFLKSPSEKTAEKFLKKFPESVYAANVIHLRDSIIVAGNTSSISREDALKVAGECLDAIGWKSKGVEQVIALDQGLNVRILSPDGTLKATHNIPLYTLEEAPGEFSLVSPLEVAFPIGTRNYLHFAYLNGKTEYVEVLYMPAEDIVHQAMFYGTPLKGEPFRIEGESPESMEGLTLAPEVAWICGRMVDNPSLVPLSKADLLTDQSIRWWKEKNPKAETSATKLSFGALDPESSLAEAYRKAPKEKGKSYNAALFNIRGDTVICAGSKSTGECLLVWCEPVCKNKKRDKLLNSIYFENDGTTLDLFYYKGNTTFKLKISMASQALRR